MHTLNVRVDIPFFRQRLVKQSKQNEEIKEQEGQGPWHSA